MGPVSGALSCEARWLPRVAPLKASRQIHLDGQSKRREQEEKLHDVKDGLGGKKKNRQTGMAKPSGQPTQCLLRTQWRITARGSALDNHTWTGTAAHATTLASREGEGE
eukprot:contig_10995_g2627